VILTSVQPETVAQRVRLTQLQDTEADVRG